MTKILIADDQPQNLYMLEVVLKSHGYEVITAANGAEALKRAGEDPPDLIVTDILMPVMDGFALCRQWRADERLRDIPFIFYTATYTEPKDEQFALSLGADRYLIKPQEPEVLVREVERVLESAGPKSELAPLQLLGEEVEFLRKHNEQLFHKLEHKMEKLARANRELRMEMAEHARAEARIAQLNATLETRIAERTAELAEANRELESFAGSVSHDLRAPLRRVDGLCYLVLEDHGACMDEACKSALKAIRTEVQDMARLVESMLELSRASRGALVEEPVDLGELARGLISTMREMDPSREVDFRVAGDLGAVGDPELLRAALRNLLGNAWKFTARAKHATIEFGTVEYGGRRTYYVKDNGAGFDMAHSDRLFQPFQRLHDKEDFPGAGIGLATVHRIVRRHGGTVWAEGEKGTGATFYFALAPGPGGTGKGDGS